MTKFVDNVEMATELCCKCSMLFAMPADYQRRRREDRTTFYCPAGHPQHYLAGQDEATKLRQELERKNQILEAEQARALRLLDERDQVTKAHKRMRTRVMNGVCPCCNRQFQNLLKHMQTQHAEERTLRVLREAYGLTQSALATEIGIKPAYVSLIENERPVPAYAKMRADTWLESQGPKNE